MSPCENKLETVINSFNNLFLESHETILIAGGAEPIYLPKDSDNSLNRIIFRSDYMSSALHEISHWCLAGSKRRELVDFGYWYNPDGRNEKEQGLFMQVEVNPQALEWILSDACKHVFNFSYDNLDGEMTGNLKFEEEIKVQKEFYLSESMPNRARILKDSWNSIFK
jgi:elongation factor P hydroxylase